MPRQDDCRRSTAADVGNTNAQTFFPKMFARQIVIGVIMQRLEYLPVGFGL